MASLVYAVWSITNVASMHCAVRVEISPCTCEPVYAHNYVELSCEKVDSFHQIVDALSNRFEPNINISLKISHSQLEDLEMRSFTDMNLNVVKLRMQWNGMRSVPELPFRGLSNVEFLSVGDNELEEIPKHMLNHMPLVKTLDIGRCRIRSVLQDDFRGTQLVTNLFLPRNNITRLDKGSFPPGLVTLHLGRNQIESLNGTLRDLNKLESLFINMNSINTLENDLPESNRLKLIIAQNNRLEHLPDNMRYMTKLETLHLQYNRLKALNGVLKNAKNLNIFYAFNNEIEHLAADEFQSSEALEELDLAFNKIKSLNFSLLPLAHLCSANFSFNDIEEFSMNEIRGLAHLKQLDVSNNRILKLTGRRENNVDQDSFLIQFNLDHNQLKSLDGALMGLNSLRILSLSYNQIERILPEDFIGLVKLEILELSHNQLLTLKEMETTSLPSLKILKVAFNNLTRLEKDFNGLPVLCQANLTNNQITSLSPELVSRTRCMNHNVPGKLELHLEENPIMCDENLNVLCPVMAKQEARIRGRSHCFEGDQEVCTVLPMLFTPFIITDNLPILLQQQGPVNVKPMVQVIVPSPILLNKQQDMLPPLIAPLGQPIIKPLIIQPQPLAPLTVAIESAPKTLTIHADTTTTTVQQQTTNANENDTAFHASGVVTREAPQHVVGGAGNASAPIPVESVTLQETDTNYSTIAVSTSTSAPTTSTTTTTTTSIAPSTTTSQPELTPPPEAPTLFIELGEDAVVAPPIPVPVAVAVANTDNVTALAATSLKDGNAEIAPAPAAAVHTPSVAAIPAPTVATSASPATSQTEYATVEYIPNLNEFLPGNHPPDVLDEDSNSNSVHEEFPSVVLADLDTAPQSLLIPEEPPENP